MRNWDSPEGKEFLSSIIKSLGQDKVLTPEVFGFERVLDLSGISFPESTAKSDSQFRGISRISGNLTFNDSLLQGVDFSKSKLESSVWNNCIFRQVIFDKSRLHDVRFFGCQFESCTFRNTDLKNSSLSISNNGRESEVVDTLFEKSDFRGASCHNPRLKNVTFANCKLDDYVFEGALLDSVKILGKYRALSFRGTPNDPERNMFKVDMSQSTFTWLNADFGVDLTYMTPPADGSCLIVKDRLNALNIIHNKFIGSSDKNICEVVRFLLACYSNQSISPLEHSQTSFVITKAQIKSFIECTDDVVDSLFNKIRELIERKV